jgi:hypothetical protein
MPRLTFNRPAALLSAIMLTALIAVAGGAAQRFNPDWDRVPLIVVAFLVTLEAGFVQRAVSARRLSLGERIRYLAPELLLLMVSMRFVASISIPNPHIGETLRAWLYDPLLAIDAMFALYCVIGLAIGYLAHATASDVASLEPQAADEANLRADDHERFAVFLADERAAALRRIGTRFGAGGAILLIALSLEAVNLRQIGGLPESLSFASISAALIYIVSGFLLHSRARLAALQARWQIEGAHVAANVARRWLTSSILLVGGVLAIAALLPHNYGADVLNTLNNALGMIGYGFAIAGYLVTWLFGMLLMLPALLLAFLLPDNNVSASGGIPPFVPPPVPQSSTEQQYQPALLFWVCIAALAILAFHMILQRHPHLVRRLIVAVRRGLRWVIQLCRGTLNWAEMAIGAIQAAWVDSSTQTAAPHVAPAARLDPRDRVIRYYRSASQAASAAGHPRYSNQTPAEYHQALADQIPEAAPDFTHLTDAYVRVRYSPYPITPVDAHNAKGPWQRLRKLLRAKNGTA